MNYVGILIDLVCNLEHDPSEFVQRFFALRLGRLDHHSLFNYEWEVNGGRVNSEVEEALGNVQRAHAGALLTPPRENKFVHAGTWVCEVIRVLEQASEVIGVEYGGLADCAQTIAPLHQNVGKCTRENSEMPVESFELAN